MRRPRRFRIRGVCPLVLCAAMAAAARVIAAPVEAHELVLLCRGVYERSAAGVPECDAGRPFVTGGLVPRVLSRTAREPRACVPPTPLSEALSRRAYYLLPDRAALERSWSEYGGCGFANPREYFDRLSDLYDRIVQPDFEGVHRPLRVADVRTAFVRANGPTGMRPEHVAVFADDGSPRAVSICYGANFRSDAVHRPRPAGFSPHTAAAHTSGVLHALRRSIVAVVGWSGCRIRGMS